MSEKPNKGIKTPKIIKVIISEIDIGFFTRLGSISAWFMCFKRLNQDMKPKMIPPKKAIHTSKLMILLAKPKRWPS